MFPGKTLEQLTPAQALAVQKETRLSAQVAVPPAIAIFTLNALTGEVKIFDYHYAWTDHLQFSPTDPTLLMYAHEGSWHEVDRIWTVRCDGNSAGQLMHTRTVDMEIVGHEFWGKDGNWIWYDQQTPRSQVFWIGGHNIQTGQEIKYHLEQNWWSIHFNVSSDGKMFAGDGGDPGQVAFAPDGEWINLFRVQPDGTVTREKLVNMSKHTITDSNGKTFTVAHNFQLEPNVSISPDGKYVVFRSNMFGPEHAFAVEINK
jgi:oligogalacturonide lyase